MRKFDISFRNDLRKRVESIESTSGAEVVVAILPRASHYMEYFLGAGAVLSILVLTIMMFIPAEIWYVYIYFETIGIGVVGGGLLWVIQPLLRAIVGKKELGRRTDLRANAIFQKAKIYETQQRVGVLLVFFWLERMVMLLPDKGVTDLVPPDELESLHAQCQKVFTADDPPQALLNALDMAREVFAKYVPTSAHPINELPDDLWID
jgi:uncharacterized membrane protein